MIELFGEIEVKRIEGQVNIMAVRPSGDCQAKTVTPTAEQQIVLPDFGYSALSRVTVEGAKLQAKTVAPATGAQEVKPDEGFLGLSGVTVEAAPLQEITAEIAAEIQHLVPDPGFYGFSGVTIKALPDAETAAFCESVSLPEIPAEVLEALPFAVITEMDNGGTTIYLLAAAESAFFYGPGSIIGQSYDKFLGSLGAGTAYYTTAEGTSWTKVEDRPEGSMVTEMADTSRVVYSNHDIYQVEDDGSGNLSVDILYYAKSGLYGVAISDAYRIQRETMEDLGDQVNRLTGTAESMTPGRMTQKLEGLNIQLQELTVVATEEVQTITPPSGVYGFSKVIVEAVEDSGSSGGGTGPGTGGEGGEDGDDTPTVPDITGGSFGNVAANEGEEVYTGKMLFNGTALPPLPADVLKDYPYAVIEKNGTMYVLYMTKEACTTNSSGYLTHGAPMGQRSSYTSAMETWSTPGAQYSNNIKASRIIWANYAIYNADNTVARLPSTPTYEKNTNIEVNYADAEESYTISGDDANRLGAIAQALTGSNDTMSWEEIMETLETTLTG